MVLGQHIPEHSQSLEAGVNVYMKWFIDILFQYNTVHSMFNVLHVICDIMEHSAKQ